MADVVKQFNKKNQIWYTQQDDETKIGFTNQFLNIINDCWHVTLVNKTPTIKANTPLLSIETNDSLFSITSPVDGSLVTFSDLAQNFPDKLTENDVVCVLTKQKAKAQPVKIKPPNHEVLWANDFTTALNGGAEPTPPAPMRPAMFRTVRPTFNVDTARGVEEHARRIQALEALHGWATHPIPNPIRPR